MSKIMDAFATKTSLLHGVGGTPEQILQAEQELGVPFSEEYHEYLSLYGIAAYDGHELTGLSKSQRLNVVFSTLEARKKYPCLPAGLYVVEETGIEELIVLQNIHKSMESRLSLKERSQGFLIFLPFSSQGLHYWDASIYKDGKQVGHQNISYAILHHARGISF